MATRCHIHAWEIQAQRSLAGYSPEGCRVTRDWVTDCACVQPVNFFNENQILHVLFYTLLFKKKVLLEHILYIIKSTQYKCASHWFLITLLNGAAIINFRTCLSSQGLDYARLTVNALFYPQLCRFACSYILYKRNHTIYSLLCLAFT